MVYSLIGAGLNMIYGVMRVVNFAHGQFLMIAAYMAYWFYKLFNVNPLISVELAAPVFFASGVALYHLTARRLQRAEDPEIASFLAYFGISLALTSAALVAWGADPRGMPLPYSPASVNVFGFSLPTGRILAFIISVVIVALLFYFLYRTYYGKALRAVIENKMGAQILGINVNNISALAFGIGLALAGVAGVLTTFIFPSIYPGVGASYTLIAFAIIVLGGLGNPVGAIVGGLIYGIAESLSTVFLPLALSPAVAFLILIIVVMFRPQGILYRG